MAEDIKDREVPTKDMIRDKLKLALAHDMTLRQWYAGQALAGAITEFSGAGSDENAKDIVNHIHKVVNKMMEKFG